MGVDVKSPGESRQSRFLQSAMSLVRRFFVEIVWARLALPAGLVIVHLIVSILAISSLGLLDWSVRIIRIDQATIPHFHIKLGEWILDLEVLSASVVIIAGVIEALVVLILGIILDCMMQIREFRKTWRC
jgi:hypothetical protein